jgi:uncharacterized protein (TIRG00374 family)
LPLLGLLLLAWVISRQDLHALRAAFTTIQTAALLQAAGMFSLNMALKSLRWQRMLDAQKLRLPLPVAVAAFFTSQFYGQVTLGRIGELYKAEALTERGVPLGIALSSSLYDRLLDLAAVLLVAAVLATTVVGDARAGAVAGACMALLMVGALVLLRARSLGGLGPVARLRAWLESRRGTRGALGMLVQLIAGLGPLLRPRFVLEATAWTIASWALYFASVWQVAAGLDIHASATSLTAGSALGALSALLPVTISGLGAREVIFMNVLAQEGVEPARAVVLSLLHLAMMTVCAIALGLLGLLARQRQHRSGVVPLRVEGSADS